MRALVVDDSSTMRRILASILRETGFTEVLEAGDGAAAIEVLTRHLDRLPVLALVDWNMPVMNGYELVRKLRADRSFDAMRLMMVTTESELAKVAAALEAGADEFLMKPFTSAMVTDKLSLLDLAAP